MASLPDNNRNENNPSNGSISANPYLKVVYQEAASSMRDHDKVLWDRFKIALSILLGGPALSFQPVIPLASEVRAIILFMSGLFLITCVISMARLRLHEAEKIAFLMYCEDVWKIPHPVRAFRDLWGKYEQHKKCQLVGEIPIDKKKWKGRIYSLSSTTMSMWILMLFALFFIIWSIYMIIPFLMKIKII